MRFQDNFQSECNVVLTYCTHKARIKLWTLWLCCCNVTTWEKIQYRAKVLIHASFRFFAMKVYVQQIVFQDFFYLGTCKNLVIFTALVSYLWPLSCWKMKPLPISCFPGGSGWWIKIWLYISMFISPLKSHADLNHYRAFTVFYRLL